MSGSFFVPPDAVAGWATDAPPAADDDVLGRAEVTCSRCGREWRFPQAACACGSAELTTRIHEPKLLERIGTTIRAVVVPAKPKSPPATDAQVALLRSLQDSVEHLLADLHSLDEQLRAAVRADCEQLQPAQGLVNLALSISGDRNRQRVPGLSLGLESFCASLDAILKDLDEDSK